MRITHNIPALNARKQLDRNNKAVSKNLEKLSSGMKINRASDDAAGLAISEKMRGQIRGLEMAENNSTDAISLLQTAEGSLNETHAILKRMQELAVQSTNGTYEESVDRVQLEKELVALKSEIDRIASSTHFNNKKLLDGTLSAVPATDGAIVPGVNGQNVALKQEIRFPVEAPVAYLPLVINDDYTSGRAARVSVADEAAAPGSAAKSIADVFNSSTKANHADYVATANGKEVILTAKTVGVQPEWSDHISGTISSMSNVTVFGRDEGKGDVATKTKYTLDFDIARLNGGEKITLGNLSITFINDPVTGDYDDSNYNYFINIYDAKQEALDPTTDDYTARFFLIYNVGTYLTEEGNVANGGETNSALSVFPSEDYPFERVTLKADNAGSGSSLNQIKISNANPAALSGTFTEVGKDAGKDGPARFATATIKMNTSRLTAGNSLKFGINELKIIASDTLAGAGEITEADAQAGGQVFIDKLEEIGAAGTGKASYNANTKELIFTSTKPDETAAAFTASLPTFTFTPGAAGAFPNSGITFQIGANGGADQRVTLNIEEQSCSALGIGAISIASDSAANDALNLITDATNQVSGTRADLGAMQNRLEHTITNLGVSVENLTAAESRVRDVDMAKEMMEKTKNDILSQSSQAMLAQANTLPQGVLQLIQ